MIKMITALIIYYHICNKEMVPGTKSTILRSSLRVRMEAELVVPVGSTAGAGSRPPCVAEATLITVQTVSGKPPKNDQSVFRMPLLGL